MTWAPALRRLLLLLACTAGLPCLAAPAYYLVLREQPATGAIELLSSHEVELAEAPAAAAPAAADDRAARSLTARIVDPASGRTLFETAATTSRWLRSETADDDGRIQGHHRLLDEVFYVLRVPRLPGRLQARSASAPAQAQRSWALDVPLASPQAFAPPARATPSALTRIVDNGPPANRLDILILGDGYTAEQEAQFRQDAATLAERFFSITPYREYRTLANVSALFVASRQSGASKPACAATPGSAVVTVDTAFSASYCLSGVRRLIGIDTRRVLEAAATVPDWDRLFVLVNDTEYGGAGGGSTSVASLNASSTQIMQHEFGHSFSRLADEYDAAFPGFAACSDRPGGRAPCEPNVTDVVDGSAPVKWQGWVDAGTPLPTTGALADRRAAGAWAGARYLASGMYRQCYDGLMRSFSFGQFCKVDTEAFILRLYGGGWGSPAAGVRTIEPGSTTPAANAQVPAGDCRRYQAQVAGPAGTELEARWSVDGRVVAVERVGHGATVQLDQALALGAGRQVTLTVTDPSPLLLEPQRSTFSWTIDARAAARPDSERLFDWAERTYPELFAPPGQATQSIAPYRVRYYPGTQNYLGTADCAVYVYGPATGYTLLRASPVVDLMQRAADAGF